MQLILPFMLVAISLANFVYVDNAFKMPFHIGGKGIKLQN